MAIHKHDIIKINEQVYINYEGGRWCDHFVIKSILYRVKTEPTNNGNFTALTSTGKLKHFNTANKNITEVLHR